MIEYYLMISVESIGQQPEDISNSQRLKENAFQINTHTERLFSRMSKKDGGVPKWCFSFCHRIHEDPELLEKLDKEETGGYSVVAEKAWLAGGAGDAVIPRG